jgi:hypothetical protein
MEFYKDNSKLKWVILAVSIIISIGSIFYTNVLVEQLKERERNQVNLYARALEYTVNESNNNIFFVSEEIINKNNSIPTMLLTEQNDVIDFNNLEIDSNWSVKKRNEALQRELEKMKSAYPPIEILLKDPTTQLRETNRVLQELIPPHAADCLPIHSTFGNRDLRIHFIFGFQLFEDCRTKPGVGRSCKRNSSPVGNTIIFVDGMGRSSSRR